MLQGAQAAAHYHYIATHTRHGALFRQGAVSRHKGFKGPMAIKGGGKGDQAARLVAADRCIYLLTSEIFR